MSSQSRVTSFVEVCLNTAIGFVVSALVWPFVAMAMGYPVSVTHTFTVTAIYTGLSIIRGYVVRRFFANDLHKAALNIAKRF